VFGNTTLTSSNPGFPDAFVAKIGPLNNFQFLWAKSFGGSGRDEGQALASDHAGNLYAAGKFYSPTINFDSIARTNLGSGDIFLGRLEFPPVVSITEPTN